MKWQLLLFATLCCFSASAQFSFSNRSSLLFYPNVKSGAPIGVTDMNGDGLDDLIRLDLTHTVRIDYQQPVGNFTGYTFGQLSNAEWSLSVADVDGNGYNDIFTGGFSNGLKLLKANGTGTSYSLTTVPSTPIFLQGSNFVDINNDGNLDLFACHDLGISQAYRNTGGGNFVADTTLIYPKSTVPSDNSGNYGSVWIDYNNDGHLDLYLSKCRGGVTDPLDGRRLNLLFKNDGFGNFTEVAQQVGLRPMAQSWSTDFADIDNDGDLDCFIVNHEGASKLYTNNNFGFFTEITAQSGILADVIAAGQGIQVKFEDFDCDGFVDLLYTSRGNNHCLFHNNGDNTFTNVPNAFPGVTRIHTAATGDLDNDGYVDVIAGLGSGYNGPGTVSDVLFINDDGGNNYFKVRLRGVASNPNGVGARLEIYGLWGKQIREVRSGESYGIQTSMTKHFGLGQASFIDSLVVRWPSGVIDKVVNPAINATLVLQEGTFCQPALNFASQVNPNGSVRFFDETSLGANQWLWNFGDGATSTQANPTHQYAEPGFYFVCLQASGICGSGQICRTINVNCQPVVANFVREDAGLTVSFEDQSIGNPNEWLWDFGDGTTSTEQNPQHVFPAPDSYQVCLTSSNNCGASQICETFAIGCNSIQASFDHEATGLSVAFTGDSNFGATDFSWTFGDGNASAEQNPTHVFELPGTYVICLEVDGGCGQATLCQSIIVACAAPQATFSYTAQELAHEFSAQVTGNADTYSWAFGDGGTSSDENPSHTYIAPGTYQVCLTVTSVCGTTQTCQALTVSCLAPQADYNYTNSGLSVSFADASINDPAQWLWDFGDGSNSSQQNPQHTYQFPGAYQVCLTASATCGGSQICQVIVVTCSAPQAAFSQTANQLSVNFQDASTNAPTTWFWNFGDSSSSTQQNPQHNYAQPGTYEVCLTATSACGNTQTCMNITISCSAPEAGFTQQQTELSIAFQDVSSNQPTQWSWTFGDGGTSTAQNPQHTYAMPGTYEVCLTATSVCGASQSCQQLTVTCAAPQAGFSFQAAGLTYIFTDQSLNQPLQWLWTFGNGNTSTQQSPSNTYALPGTYQVCLTVTSICGSTQSCQQLTVSCAPPQSAFQFVPDELAVSFSDATLGQPTQWFWNFGDGATSTQQFPSHTYGLPGTYQVCLTTTSICGSSQTCQSITVSCAAPDAGFSYQPDELQFQFQDLSSNMPLQWSWTFGDGGTSALQNPQHNYTAPGSYQVCLTATSLCGADQTCMVVVVSCIAPQADFNFSANSLTLDFSDVSLNEPTSWSWAFGDGNTSTEQNPQHTYAASGDYIVCLSVSSICGNTQRCELVEVTCEAPSPGFSFTVDGLNASFSDVTNGDPTTWLWAFGDGNTSTEQNPQHTYAASGTYQVCLLAGNDCGSLQHCVMLTISCSAPEVAFSVSDVSELTRLFQDASTNNPTSWLWDFGDGNTSTDQNPLHTYAFGGSVEVCLIASNSCGSDTLCQLIVETNAPDNALPIMRLYPNPVSELLHIQCENWSTGSWELSLINASGRLLRRFEWINAAPNIQETIEVSDLPAGVYWLTCRSAEGFVIERFIKQ